MLRFIGKRLLLSIPVLLGVIFIVFSIMSLTPADPGTLILGIHATPEGVAKLNHELGYDRPFFTRFFVYVRDIILHFDFGKSYMNSKPCLQEALSYFPVTLKVAVFSMTLSSLTGVTLGVLAAVRQYSVFDTVFSIAAMLFAAIPGFWVAMMLILIFALKLGVLPPSGVASWKSYVLPIATMVFGGSAELYRLTRAQMLEEIRQDYTRTALAKGAPRKVMIWRHALKNAILPVITSIGNSFGGLLGGAIIVETIFGMPGIGTYMLKHIFGKDVPVVMTCTLILATMFYLIILIVDIAYALIDPRIRAQYARASGGKANE
ncbi:MAG: ABC transporter permease [Firmicutes bacterium]|nr:ABC transporter permease [Bacillota bacterium]